MSPRALTLLSWNIHSCIGMDGRCEPDRIAEVLGGIEFDVACLQEVGWHLRGTKGLDQFAVLERGIEGRHIPALTKTRNAHFGNLIISRLPVTATEVVPLGRWWTIPRLMQTARLEAGGLIANTHLGLDPVERTVQLRRIRSHLLPVPAPVLLCGDFNCMFDGPDVKALCATFDEAHAFTSFPSPKPLLRLDRMMARGLKSVEPPRALDNDVFRLVSDHLPVLGRFAAGGA